MRINKAVSVTPSPSPTTNPTSTGGGTNNVGNTPQTGDTINPIIWLLIAATSLVLVGVISHNIKKSPKNGSEDKSKK